MWINKMNYDTLLQKLREQRLVLDTLTREQRRTREQVTAALGRIKQHDLQSIEDTVEHILYTVLRNLGSQIAQQIACLKEEPEGGLVNIVFETVKPENTEES